MLAARRAARRRRRLDRLAVAGEFRLEPLSRFARLRASVYDVGALERERVRQNDARARQAPDRSPAPRR